MKGKGGPDNPTCQYRGVRQRTWGKWVAEIREPNRGNRLWLGTFPTAYQAAHAYDEAARAMYGPYARVNLPENIADSCHEATSESCGSTTTSSHDLYTVSMSGESIMKVPQVEQSMQGAGPSTSIVANSGKSIMKAPKIEQSMEDAGIDVKISKVEQTDRVTGNNNSVGASAFNNTEQKEWTECGTELLQPGDRTEEKLVIKEKENTRHESEDQAEQDVEEFSVEEMLNMMDADILNEASHDFAHVDYGYASGRDFSPESLDFDTKILGALDTTGEGTAFAYTSDDYLRLLNQDYQYALLQEPKLFELESTFDPEYFDRSF